MTGRDWLLVLVPLAYVLGSIPWGLVVGLSRGVDPRKAGSGNIGATNVGRLLGGKYFALVFVLDMLKGMVPMLLAGAALRGTHMTQNDYLGWLAVGAAAIVGHMFSCFLKFKGGKGVATSAGVGLGLWPYYTLPALVGLAVFIVVFRIWRYVSLASIVAAVTFPVAYVVLGEIYNWGVFGRQLWLLVFAVGIAAMIVVRHRTNIARLRAGTENRFDKKREKATSATDVRPVEAAPRLTLDDGRPCRLRLGVDGLHRFGGTAAYEGLVPAGTDVPLHLVLLLDLSDPECPIKSDGSIGRLPLFYPLKYGYGGPEVQYRVVSDERIEILYLSDAAPDPDDQQYVRVSALPASPARLIRLSEEEARAIEPEPGGDRRLQILESLTRDHPLALVGNNRSLPGNFPAVVCRSPGCRSFGRTVAVDVIASVPPLPVDGADDFWHEYQGGDLEFYFCLCRDCRTVIAFNVAG